jgi:hypothetical protein
LTRPAYQRSNCRADTVALRSSGSPCWSASCLAELPVEGRELLPVPLGDEHPQERWLVLVVTDPPARVTARLAGYSLDPVHTVQLRERGLVASVIGKGMFVIALPSSKNPES